MTYAREVKSALLVPYRNWRKLGWWFVFSLIPILNFMTVGYLCEIIRERKGELPVWVGFWHLFKSGIGLALVTLAWIIPLTFFAWFFDYIIFLVPLVYALLIYILPRIWVLYARRGWKYALSTHVLRVFNWQYFFRYLTGLFITFVYMIVAGFVVTPLAFALGEFAAYLIMPLHSFVTVIPFFLLVSKVK